MTGPQGLRRDGYPLRLWIVGPAGGGKSALLGRLRAYGAAGWPELGAGDLPAGAPGAGHGLLVGDLPAGAPGAGQGLLVRDLTTGTPGAGQGLLVGDLPAGAPRPVVDAAQDFVIAQRGAGQDLALDAGRVIYVARAARAHLGAPPPITAEVWLVPEGEESQGMAREPLLFYPGLRDVGGTLTLLPAVFPALASAPELRPARERYVAQRLLWGFDYLELRDDLLDDEQLVAAAALIPGARRLVSARRRRSAGTGQAEWAALRAAAEGAALWDWPLELGPVPQLGLGVPRVASLHTRLGGESLDAAIQRLEAAGAGAELLKLAVPVGDLAELGRGQAWVLRDPQRHQFLPSCAQGSGRWSWYRLWRGRGQRLNFVRERAAAGNAPSADQPTLYEWLLRATAPAVPGGGPAFAALLGDPVAHSRTPAEQRRYFAGRDAVGGWPTLLVAVTDADLRACEPLTVLGELGLRAAAVTAPRKHDARAWLEAAGGTFVVSDARDPTTVCNTLGRASGGAWFGTNTDGFGLRAGWSALCTEHPELVTARIALWGGGGTQGLLRSAFPQAVAYAARTGQPRPGETIPGSRGPQSRDPAMPLAGETPPSATQAQDGAHLSPAPQAGWTPDVVVWAVGRSRQPECAWPSPDWRPRFVFDLNYSEDSPGRQYAARCGAKYESGLRFFQAQAAAQRRFWDEVLP